MLCVGSLLSTESCGFLLNDTAVSIRLFNPRFTPLYVLYIGIKSCFEQMSSKTQYHNNNLEKADRVIFLKQQKHVYFYCTNTVY